MIAADKRQAVYLLHQDGMSLREIAHRLHLSRNTVRAILKQKGEMPLGPHQDGIRIEEDLLRRLYADCKGWMERMHEKLVEEEGLDVSYSTLRRRVHELGLGQGREQQRCDRVPDVAGAEMQHDTSPYRVQLGTTTTVLIASLIYLRYSKRRFLRFYRRFNRFQMKCFFHEALRFWGYAAKICIIDNTSLARLRGTGADAVLVPEMADFAREHGFPFVCHEKGHANRKAGEERSFWTVETTFFPGRSFASLENLNPVPNAELRRPSSFTPDRNHLNDQSGSTRATGRSRVRRLVLTRGMRRFQLRYFNQEFLLPCLAHGVRMSVIWRLLSSVIVEPVQQSDGGEFFIEPLQFFALPPHGGSSTLILLLEAKQTASVRDIGAISSG